MTVAARRAPATVTPALRSGAAPRRCDHLRADALRRLRSRTRGLLIADRDSNPTCDKQVPKLPAETMSRSSLSRIHPLMKPINGSTVCARVGNRRKGERSELILAPCRPKGGPSSAEAEITPQTEMASSWKNPRRSSALHRARRLPAQQGPRAASRFPTRAVGGNRTEKVAPGWAFPDALGPIH